VVVEPVKPLRIAGSSAVALRKTAYNGTKSPTNGHGPASPAMPMPAPEAQGEALKLTGELSLLLVEIGAGWPEGIRSELSVLTGDTKVILPVAEVSAGLQKGKSCLYVGQVRNWLKSGTDDTN
jgi:hypothetical protein